MNSRASDSSDVGSLYTSQFLPGDRGAKSMTGAPEEVAGTNDGARGTNVRALLLDFLKRSFSALWTLIVAFVGCIPELLFKGSPVIVGAALALLAELLLFIGIFFRAKYTGRRGTAWCHGVAILSILMILIFVWILAIARWTRRFEVDKQDGTDKARDDASSDDEEKNLPLNTMREDDHLESIDLTGSGENSEATPTATSTDASGREKPTKRLIPYLSNKTKWFALLVLTPLVVMMLVFTEITLWYQMPRNSIIKLDPNQLALSPKSEYVPAGCEIQERWDEAVKFFNGSISVADVLLVYVNNPFTDAPAYQADSTVYLPEYSRCPSVRLLVHEMVHVWQEQTSYWSGPGAPGRFIRMRLDRLRCSWCLEDYGGREGIITALEQSRSGNTTAADIKAAFGPEQMAEIVEDYYYHKLVSEMCDENIHEVEGRSLEALHSASDGSQANTSELLFYSPGHNSTGNSTMNASESIDSQDTADVDKAIEPDDDYSGFQFYEEFSNAEYCEALRFYSCQVINC
ncbi:expressed unknown protein [Seminavis robusta]|uniref:Uncharacterized protein n=1 Tax=Seminavis robusta TaxID=568900 RepID=A0A9N8H932_9STRA|nr:expressed unknown protein [Seminavis robusta]|eukprot:Sro241_g096340.1 n/a (517) ;mRNA; f:40678-42228